VPVNLIAISLSETIVSLFLVIFGLLSMIFTTGLFIYHTNLIIKNLTTKDEINGTYDNSMGNPWNQGIKRNIKRILCPKVQQPSLLTIIKGNFRRDRTKKNVLTIFNFSILLKRILYLKKNIRN
jgi:hypothetical protein